LRILGLPAASRKPISATIRNAAFTDLQRLVDIYNEAIAAQFETADTEAVNAEGRAGWLNGHLNEAYPVIIEEENGLVRGYLSISPYRPGRKALQGCVEVSYYVARNWQGQGIGSRLLASGLEVCKGNSYHSVLAIILDRNERSINLIKKFGFTQWGHLPGIASFNGTRCGHVYYGKQLGQGAK
jgi:phosphinothricin acetyltransferase